MESTRPRTTLIVAGGVLVPMRSSIPIFGSDRQERKNYGSRSWATSGFEFGLESRGRRRPYHPSQCGKPGRNQSLPAGYRPGDVAASAL